MNQSALGKTPNKQEMGEEDEGMLSSPEDLTEKEEIEAITKRQKIEERKAAAREQVKEDRKQRKLKKMTHRPKMVHRRTGM